MLDSYLRDRIQSTLDDGVTHVASEFSKRFENLACITKQDLIEWLQEIQSKMDATTSFTIDHSFYWSLKSHLTDIIKHA